MTMEKFKVTDTTERMSETERKKKHRETRLVMLLPIAMVILFLLVGAGYMFGVMPLSSVLYHAAFLPLALIVYLKHDMIRALNASLSGEYQP